MSIYSRGVVEEESAEYEVHEALLSSFQSEGHARATVSSEATGEDHSVDADVNLEFRVASADEIAEITDADFDLNWDGKKFVRYAKYMIDWETVEYVTTFDCDAGDYNVTSFDAQVDRVAQRLFDLEPVNQDPSFLFPQRDPNGGPPPIDSHPGVFIEDDIQYQLQALGHNDRFCLDWMGTTDFIDHLVFIKNGSAPLSHARLYEKFKDVDHIGAGRPHVDAVDSVTQVSLARFKNGLSLGLWFPYQPVNIEGIWELAEQMGANRVTAVEKFPTAFRPQVPPEIWNCFPEPPKNWCRPKAV